MTYRLIGIPLSRAARNIWMFEELGLAYELEHLHYKDPALKQSPYIDWNPNGSIPVLLTDGQPIYESLAINLYLANKHGQLLGDSPEQFGLVMQWSFWAATSIEALIGQWAYNTSLLPEQERQPALAETALVSLRKPLAVLEKAVSQSRYLVGQNFTAADLNVAAVARVVPTMPLAAEFPNTIQWLQQCWSRPAALKVRRLRGESV